MKNIFFLFASFILFSTTSLSQEDGTTDTTKIYLIINQEGHEFLGEIISDDGREVLMKTNTIGLVYIPKYTIKTIQLVDSQESIIAGEYQHEGPFTTRYAFTTNALPIKKGEHYTMINIYGPEVHFATRDNVSLGVMSSWIASPFVLAGKITMPTKNEKLNFSVGTLIGTSGYLNNFRGFGGLHFANMTIGTKKKNITFAGGYAYIQPGFTSSWLEEGTTVVYSDDSYYYGGYNYSSTVRPITQGPVFSVAGIIKVGPKASFVFDSMIGVFSQRDYDRDVNTVTVTEPVNSGGVYTPGYYEHTITVTHFTNRTTALFVMPGMRFHKNDRRAFQVSLAGVSVFDWADIQSGSNNFSFPVPMCSWFFKF